MQVALQRVIKSKAAKQQQKQQAILQELQATFASQVGYYLAELVFIDTVLLFAGLSNSPR